MAVTLKTNNNLLQTPDMDRRYFESWRVADALTLTEGARPTDGEFLQIGSDGYLKRVVDGENVALTFLSKTNAKDPELMHNKMVSILENSDRAIISVYLFDDAVLLATEAPGGDTKWSSGEGLLPPTKEAVIKAVLTPGWPWKIKTVAEGNNSRSILSPLGSTTNDPNNTALHHEWPINAVSKKYDSQVFKDAMNPALSNNIVDALDAAAVRKYAIAVIVSYDETKKLATFMLLSRIGI